MGKYPSWVAQLNRDEAVKSNHTQYRHNISVMFLDMKIECHSPQLVISPKLTINLWEGPTP